MEWGKGNSSNFLFACLLLLSFVCLFVAVVVCLFCFVLLEVGSKFILKNQLEKYGH